MFMQVAQALAVGVMVAMTPVSSASAAESTLVLSADFLKELARTIKLAKKLHTYLDTASKMATEDVPGLTSDSFELQQREQRARRFKVESRPPPAPKVDGDRVLSNDAKTRADARKEWADFVGDEAHFLERLKERRAQQAEHLATLERQYESLANLVEELPDLIGEVSQAIPVNVYYVNKLGELQLQADQNLRTASSLLDEYRRIVREYDGTIRKVSIDHDSHRAMLRTIEAIQGAGSPNGVTSTSSAPAAVPKTSPGPAGPTHKMQPGAGGLATEIGTAAGNAIGDTRARAYDLQTRVQDLRNSAPPAPSPSSGPNPTVNAPVNRPDYELELRMQSNGGRR